MLPTLHSIHLYPIKSTLDHPVSQAVVQTQGLAFDREFMLTEPNGKFISARKEAALYHFSAIPVPFGLYITHNDGSRLVVNYRDFIQSQDCEVWGTEFASFVAADEINRWFSEKVGRNVQLRWLGEQSQRRIKRFPDNPLSFADGYPLLLTNTKSLEALENHCPHPIKMAQFRPNIVIEGNAPFEEQQWDKIRIGEVTFLHTKPCERCVLTTRDPDNNELHPQMEPFRTLKKVNPNEEGKPIFGINLLPLNSGIIRVEDKVNILFYRT